MAKFEIPITQPTRGCIVGGRPGYFHLWEQYSEPIPASPLVGGAPAGVVSQVFGIVEFSDSVERVPPYKIKFTDECNDALNVLEKIMNEKEIK